MGRLQVQKKKNSRSYQRTLIYLYLQKLNCPKCSRILGGKATTKKNGNIYFYYYCNDCKISFKEKIVDDFMSKLVNELVEYDSVVNQFFLPMIKQKFDEPKEQLEKEINNQKNRLERIKKAYIDSVFELEEYNKERKIVEKALTELEEVLLSKNKISSLDDSNNYSGKLEDEVRTLKGTRENLQRKKRKSVKQEDIDDFDKQLKELAPKIKSLNEDIQNLYMIERRTILWKKEAEKAITKEKQRLEEIERIKGKGKSKKYVR